MNQIFCEEKTIMVEIKIEIDIGETKVQLYNNEDDVSGCDMDCDENANRSDDEDILKSEREDKINLEDEDVESLHQSWWVNLDDSLKKKPIQVNTIPELRRKMRHWIIFLQFSQMTLKNKLKFNPYTASMQEVTDFFQFLQLTHTWTMKDSPGKFLDSLAAMYLTSISQLSVVELLNSHPPKLTLSDVMVARELSGVSPYNNTWASFVSFCQKLEVKKGNIARMNPFLAEPELVTNFLNSMFQGEAMMAQGQAESFFRPSYNLYSENLARISTELDWHLRSSWMIGPLMLSKEMCDLVAAATNCDERLLTDRLALELSPKHTYSKRMVDYSDSDYWKRQFTQNVLTDVKRGALPVFVAASGLGVTAEMVFCWTLKQGATAKQENISVNDYVNMGFGTRSMFWKEGSTMELLETVRDRKSAVEEVAAQLGVSRREILDKCGGLKTDAEIEAEKTLADLEQMKNKAEQDLIGKKKQTQLEFQIELAEKNLCSLSEYERHRLNNMKERQVLVEKLDFDKDKRELRALTPKNQTRKVQAAQLREKSARVRRRSQLEQVRQCVGQHRDMTNNKWASLQKQRLSPKWFGHWVPRVNKVKTSSGQTSFRKNITDININDVYDEKTISSYNHIPKFELSTEELLEITPKYQMSRTMLESMAAECKHTRLEEKLVTKPDWSKFELVQDTIVSSSALSSLDSCGDLVCYGTECGGVGVFLAGRSVTLRPHCMTVVRVLFTGRDGQVSTGIMSAGLDGTVRMTDLVKQSVSLEYSWDQSYSGKNGINWMEKRGIFSYLLDCGVEVNQIDTRSREAVNLIQLTDQQTMPYNNCSLSVSPANRNLICLSRKQTVQIWDLRKCSESVHTLQAPPGSHNAGGGWSSAGGYLVTCVQQFMGKSVPVFYSGQDLSQPVLTWDRPGHTTYSGITWCTWQENIFFTSQEQPQVFVKKQKVKLEPKKSVVAVDCTDGHTVGELSSGLDFSNCMVHCHNSRHLVVVGNSKGPGGLAVFNVPKQG